MARIEQSFCYGLFLDEGGDVGALVERAAEIGYAAVELWGRAEAPFDEICEAAEKNGLVVASTIGHRSLEDGLNKRENHSRIEDELRESIEVAPYIGHFHTAGNPGGNEMDDTQELNYAGICRAIAATGYDLYLGHEFVPKGDKLAALEAAFRTCDRG